MGNGLRNTDYKPPFPWFGGKSPVADVVWQALGDVKNYVEPFFGSGATLFLRPGGAGDIETINDADGFVANFWRATQHDSDAVAEHADRPVNENDLHAIHLRLLARREELTEKLCGDIEYYDARIAGEWVWGLCCWIGSGWCSGKGPWQSVDGKMVRVDSNSGRGVNRKLPHLGDAGRGVNRQPPHLGNAGQGECEARLEYLKNYLGWFRDRLRNVRVCCGDWSRVCGPTVTFKHGLTGVFLDPPYADTAERTEELYSVDCLSVAHDVREWAIELGKRKDMRIVLAGYEGEHDMPSVWQAFEWSASGGYSSQAEEQSGNKHRERLWFSPHCVRQSRQRQMELL